MFDVGRWLAEMGLERYAEAFVANAIDADILPRLTDDDLKALGVAALGHRKRILEAIASSPSSGGLAGETRETAVDAAPREAERRQLTVMFVDLVNSTDLSVRLDPEEMREVLRGYQSAVTGELQRMEGHVAKFMGDGVLAYFGWPVAREDAAERAVRAALSVCAAVGAQRAPDGAALAARVGIATGLVVVGELIGAAEAQERAVVGDTPNLAARLQAAAPPGGVVIGHGTQRLIGAMFALDELPPLTLKGIAEPQRAWRVVGERRVEGRFDAMHAGGMVQMVGREQELALLLDRWQLAKSGEGQAVILSGEPGIGKSRIVMALRERLRGDAHVGLRYFCSPQHTGTPWWPIIRQLERAIGMTPGEPVGATLDRLDALFRDCPADAASIAPLFADLLSLENDGRYRMPELTPQERKARTMRALVDQLALLSRRSPALLILEDAHWLDSTTREAFDLIVDSVRSLPVLCVVTCRPEFQQNWTSRPHVTLISLNRLGRAHAERLVAELTQGRLLPSVLCAEILAKTEGVPLFIEELTKMVLESGLIRPGGGGVETAVAVVPLAVPDTLRDSLMARLDRLAVAREVAQIGAVLGREFEHELLAAVADLGEQQLAQALDQLVATELVFRRGVPPRVVYSFKHALVQDTAYQSLLRSRRQLFHARAAEVLRTRFTERIVAAPELLAHHLTEAGLGAAAVQAWIDAGDLALRRCAYPEAIGNLRRGLAVVAALQPSLERDRAELRLHNALGQAIHTSFGPTAEVEASYRRARGLSQAVGDERQWVRASYGLWFCHNWRMEHMEARKSAEELLRRSEGSSDATLVLQSHHAAWTTAWQLGEPQSAVEHAEIGRSIYDPGVHHSSSVFYGNHDAGVCCCNTLGIARTIMGFADRGVADAAEGEALARQVGHPFSRALSLFFRSNIHLLRGEIKTTVRLAHEMADLCAQQGIGVYGLVGRVVSGWCAAASGDDPAGGMRLMRSGLDELARVGARARRTEYLGLFADRALAVGDVSASRAALSEAHALASQTGERFFLAELHRLDAAVCLFEDRGAAAQAEAMLGRAVCVARTQSAKLFELRAAADLAQLWADRGERQRAFDMLAPVCDWFTEGRDAPRIKEIAALRAALA